MQPTEVVIIGGGPAGSAAARLLAGWGHDVLMIAGPPAARSLGESLPPSCGKLFDLLDLGNALNASGSLTSTGNTVRWAGGDTRTELFADGATGWQVDRVRFDAALREAARTAGARIESDAVVREIARSEGHRETQVSWTGPDGQRETIDAAFVLDCSGRAGVVARRGFRVDDDARTTLALTAIWRSSNGWPLREPSHTVVETYGDGWAWSVPVNPTDRYVTVMVDPAVTDQQGEGLEIRYQGELAKTTALNRLMVNASQHTAASGRDASVYHSVRYGEDRLLLVGDAASFIDPLSSYGVKKALASAWLAAVVVHSTLRDAALAGPALELFTEREQAMHAAARAQAAQFFADAARHHLHPFWTGRADDVVGPAGDDVRIEQLREDPEVLAALESLRSASALSLRPGDQLTIESRPALTTREVVMQDRLVLPAWPADGRGVRYLRDVDLVRLVELAPTVTQVPDLFDAYNRAAPPVALPDFLGALSVLMAKGALTWSAPE